MIDNTVTKPLLTSQTWLPTAYTLTSKIMRVLRKSLLIYWFFMYSFKNDRIWSFRHNYFHIDPFQGDFSIGGQHFQWSDGIFSVALSRRHIDGFRTAYFHAMSRYLKKIYLSSAHFSKVLE